MYLCFHVNVLVIVGTFLGFSSTTTAVMVSQSSELTKLCDSIAVLFQVLGYQELDFRNGLG